jgi:hypothetical protein
LRLGLLEVSEESRTKRNFIPMVRGPEDKKRGQKMRGQGKRTTGLED